MITEQLHPLVDHLWQSTLFALAAGVLTLAFRNNRAQIRYCLWLGASLKFLIPFSILVDIGGYFGTHAAARIAPSPIPLLVERFTDSFVMSPSTVMSTTPAPPASSVNGIIAALGIVWGIGFLVLVSSWFLRWRHVAAVLRTASPVHLPVNLKVMSSPEFMEPGVFGIYDPILLVPEGITEQLTPRQLEAILLHELCHVHRPDNLATAIHMVVEAVFWFHPLVWFVGGRLMEERERACDEEVLRKGSEPQAYAEAIIKVCEMYLQSPLRCVSGVTGSNLKKRVRAILGGDVRSPLSAAKKAVIAAASFLAIVGPIALGVMNPRSLRADSLILPDPRQPRVVFEVASVKPVDRALMTRNHEGKRLDREVFIDRTELYTYIIQAYIRGLACASKVGMGEACPLITGAFPSWVRTDRFEIQVKLPVNSVPSYSDRQSRYNDRPELSLMLQSLLQDRFRLKTHHEKREIPVYTLTIGKNGPKLKQSAAGSDRLKIGDGSVIEYHGMAGTRAVQGPDGTPRMRMTFQASSIQEAVDTLGWFLDRPVLDRTGLKGEYDFAIEVDVDPSLPERDHVDPTSGRGGRYFNPWSGVSSSAVSAGVQDIGLNLESTKAPVEILIIDHVEKPTEN